MTMRIECEFRNPATGETRLIAVQLTADEIDRAGGRELYEQAYALRHAYREAPAGFYHVARGVRAAAVN